MITSGKKTVLITGASSGIGNELSRLFAQDGYNLVLIGRNEASLKKLAGELEEKYNIFIKIIVKDLSLSSAPQEIYDETQKEQLNINILVNNAGFGVLGNFLETDLNKELEMIQVNIIALTQLSKLFAKEMIKNGEGKILNVSSTAAFLPGPLMAIYYASKAYILSFSEALSSELKNKNVVVTALCPGPTETNFHKNADMIYSKFGGNKILMKAETVAKEGYDGLKAGKMIVIPGARNKFLALGTRFIPREIAMKILKAARKKREKIN